MFNTDLYCTLIKADILLTKFKNPTFKKFLEKYTGRALPDERALFEKITSKIFTMKCYTIRVIIGCSSIWVSVNETTDVDGRFIANALIGKLNSEPSKPFLRSCKELDKCNHQTIAKLFNDAMGLLWPLGVKHENVLLLLLDVAPYMLKTVKALTTFYQKMLRVSCVAHGFHCVAETIKVQFPVVDSLIATIKKIFLKAPSRVLKFKDLNPNLCLPP